MRYGFWRKQECPHKTVPQERPTKVSHKSVCPTRVPYKSVLQECPTRVRHQQPFSPILLPLPSNLLSFSPGSLHEQNHKDL